MIDTKRLTLVPWDPQHLLTLIIEPESFEEVAGVRIAPGLREMFTSGEVPPEWIESLRTSPGPDVWRHGMYMLHRESDTIIGTAAYKGPPDDEGITEIAYGVAPAYEGQGYASEAAAALTDHAFGSGLVKTARAHTLPEKNASTRVLTKCGYAYIGEVEDPDDGLVWRWEKQL